jgi:hypothetical protein
MPETTFVSNMSEPSPLTSFGVKPFVFPAIILTGCYLNKTYLTKRFNFRRNEKTYKCINCDGIDLRSFSDKLVYTSALYGIAGIYAFAVEQYFFAFLAVLTCSGSTAYHYFREMNCFNCDNVFATTVAFLHLWTIYHSYDKSTSFFTFGLLGSPVAFFFIKQSGLPADIEWVGRRRLFVRTSRVTYDLWHTAWHYASAAGMFVMVHYFDTHGNADSSDTCTYGGERSTMGSSCYLDGFHIFPMVPTVALVFSICINLLGNYHGIMPMK